MGRPELVDREALLGAARDLAFEHGISAVTASAVAARVGRPSGSVYYRFPSRDHLLAEAWLEAVEFFQAGFLRALDNGDVAGAARHVVAWSRQHPARAALLTAFRRTDLLGPSWPAELSERADATSRKLERSVSDCARGLSLSAELLLAAAVDLPYGLVRRKVWNGGLTEADESLVDRAAAAVLEGAG